MAAATSAETAPAAGAKKDAKEEMKVESDDISINSITDLFGICSFFNLYFKKMVDIF